ENAVQGADVPAAEKRDPERLGERRVEEEVGEPVRGHGEDKDPARAQYPASLAADAVDVRDVLQHAVAEDRFEQAIGERQISRIGDLDLLVGSGAARLSQLADREVD